MPLDQKGFEDTKRFQKLFQKSSNIPANAKVIFLIVFGIHLLLQLLIDHYLGQ